VHLALGGDPFEDLAGELVAAPGWPSGDRASGDGNGVVQDQLAQQAPGQAEPQGAGLQVRPASHLVMS
jgi:hypothetical protein